MPDSKPPSPSLDGLLSPTVPPPPPPPAVKPVLVTEQQIEGEFGDLIQTKSQPRRRRLGQLFIIILLIAALGGALYWGILKYRRTSATVADTTTNSSPSLEGNAAPATADVPSETTTPDLTSTTGRDATRRTRLDLFATAAKAAVTKGVALPTTDHIVRLDSLSDPTVATLRQDLADQGVSADQINSYLIDPSPDSYYFGYQFDGQLLTLTTVLEDSATDCVVTPTAKGDLCILTITTAL